jgi:hypothetical protein
MVDGSKLVAAMLHQTFGDDAISVAEEITDTETPNEIRGSWDCNISANEDVLHYLLGESKFPTKIERPICIQTNRRPNPKRRINVLKYDRLLSRATSIRKAKKYAKILGFGWNNRLNRPKDSEWMIFPKCSVEVVPESGNRVSVKIEVKKNET